MNFLKITAVCLVYMLVVVGCANQKRRIEPVTTLPDSVEPVSPVPVPYPGVVYDTEPSEDPLDSNEPQGITINEPSAIDSEPAKGLPVSVKYVDGRIYQLNEKLDRWREIDRNSAIVELSQEDTEKMVNCFVDLQRVLDGYKQLRVELIQFNSGVSTTGVDRSEIAILQKNDISFLESICGRLLGSDESGRNDLQRYEAEPDLFTLEARIQSFSQSLEYEEVVQEWQRISDQQLGKVHLRTKILYGNALMFLHLEEKAAEFYQQIIEEISAISEQRTDLISLQKILADLYIASGNYLAAENQYLDISKSYHELSSIEKWSTLHRDLLEINKGGTQELSQYSGLLRNFLGFVPERDGFKVVWEADKFLQLYPYSVVAANVGIIKNSTHLRAEKWFNDFLKDIEELTANKSYSSAIEKLEMVAEDIISLEQQEQIKTKKDDLILAGAVARETQKIEKMQDLQRQWNSGLRQVDERNFDEAIAIFSSLLPTEYSSRAEQKVKEINLLAAKSERRQAADLYVKYTKASDYETKKKLLEDSYLFLNGILEKYPDVKIIDKVRGNIQRVEQEMNMFDPLLLPRLQAAQQKEIEEPVEDEDFIFSQSPQQGQPVKEAGPTY